MSDEHAHDVEGWVKKYKLVGAALFVLTIVTVAVSYIPASVAIGIGIALVVATLKGSLVASIFMHLVEEKPVIIWLLVLTFFFFLVMILIPTFWHMNAPHVAGVN